MKSIAIENKNDRNNNNNNSLSTAYKSKTIPDIYMKLYLILGEGNGTPLQYSYLETPMDGGAW